MSPAQSLVSRQRLLLALLLWPLAAPAEEPEVPVGLQATLLTKVVQYDRNLGGRGLETLQILVAVKADNPDSQAFATHLRRALTAHHHIAGKPFSVIPVTFSGTAQLVQECRARRAAVVYVAPGFSEEEVLELGQQLPPLSVLSAGALARQVRHGLVYGVEVVSGKPRLVINLVQARKQKVDFDAQFLKLARTIDQ